MEELIKVAEDQMQHAVNFNVLELEKLSLQNIQSVSRNSALKKIELYDKAQTWENWIQAYKRFGQQIVQAMVETLNWVL